MIAFKVNDMTCGHCASTIAKAVKAVDPQVRVEIDLGSHQVRIDAAGADPQALREAIEAAGYTAVPLGTAGLALPRSEAAAAAVAAERGM